jgi:hypothetical protein
VSYKPKFCCSCGEKIQRDKWTFLSSRRFCLNCETDYKLQEFMPWAVSGLSVIFALFTMGLYWQKPERAVNISSGPITTAAAKTAPSVPSTPAPGAQPQVQPEVSSVPLTLKAPPIAKATPKTSEPKVVSSAPSSPLAAETVYFCGAQTKKGTPCTRRVKGGGRCWQHKGQPSMLPPEKLVAG